MRNAAVVVVILLAVPVFAGQSAPAPKLSTGFGAHRPAQAKDPFTQLFAARQALKEAVAEAKAWPVKPRIVCGMLIVPADPSVDPKIAVTPPKDSELKYTIRGIEPLICNPAK
jgi:hypothetical protein